MNKKETELKSKLNWAEDIMLVRNKPRQRMHMFNYEKSTFELSYEDHTSYHMVSTVHPAGSL